MAASAAAAAAAAASSAAASAAPQQHPIVVVLGCTGVGKTKLSIELAKRFNGEIISTDSMQVYRGLDIATNKASAGERAQAPHHLLDFLEPPQTYDVQQFRDAALAVIADLHAQGKLPILVGGTHYYNESIIFRNLLDEVAGEGAHARAGASDGDANASAATPTASPEVLARLAALSAEDAADELARVDPVMANRLHRNDTRKILRSLEVFYATGQRQSELIMQQTDRGEEVLRFAPCCCLYLDCEQTALDARLDARVDDMLAQGLLAELEAFQARMAAASPDGELDYTRGLLQAIGFKEFREYMAAGDDCAPADKARLLEAGVADMKRATRRYARRQTTWIRNRLLRGPPCEGLRMYRLDATELAHWDTTVGQEALRIVEATLAGAPPDGVPREPRPSRAEALEAWTKYTCEACEREINGEHAWQVHVQSKRHKARVAGKRKRAARDAEAAKRRRGGEDSDKDEDEKDDKAQAEDRDEREAACKAAAKSADENRSQPPAAAPAPSPSST